MKIFSNSKHRNSTCEIVGVMKKRVLILFSYSKHPIFTCEINRSDEECVDINWDELGFAFVQTDFIYVMRCSQDQKFSNGALNRYGNIELSPSSGVLNYGQVGFPFILCLMVDLLNCFDCYYYYCSSSCQFVKF